MIHYCKGDLLESDAQALVNAVNTVGVMGKGIALQFKNQFPENYKAYHNACQTDAVGIGKLFVTEKTTLPGGRKLIINLPTKTDWRKPSTYTYVETGLVALALFIRQHSLQSVALPALGAGNGGLDWGRVKLLIEAHLSDLNCQIYVFEPLLTA